jgi:hypothetical protein
MAPEIKRTPAEAFAHVFGYSDIWGPLPNKQIAVTDDERSDLYWQVMTRARELGLDASDFLARLQAAEDEGDDFLAEHGPPLTGRYDDLDEWEEDEREREEAYDRAFGRL